MNKKRAWILVVLVLYMFGMTATPVNAASSSTQIRKVINTYMSAAKKSDVKKMRKCYKKPSSFTINIERLKKYIPSMKKLFKKNKQISYMIKSVKINGNCILRRRAATGAFASGHSARPAASFNQPLSVRS